MMSGETKETRRRICRVLTRYMRPGYYNPGEFNEMTLRTLTVWRFIRCGVDRRTGRKMIVTTKRGRDYLELAKCRFPLVNHYLQYGFGEDENANRGSVTGSAKC